MSCVLCVNVLCVQSWSHLWCSLMVCTSLYYLTWLVLCFITHCLAEMLLWFIKSTLFEFHRPMERIFSCFLTWIVCCVLNLAKQTYYFCFGYQQNEWQKEKAEPRNLGGKKEKGKGKKKEESLGNPTVQAVWVWCWITGKIQKSAVEKEQGALKQDYICDQVTSFYCMKKRTLP